MADETETDKYNQARQERGEGQVIDCIIPGEIHRYHYHGPERPGFYVTAQLDGTIVRFHPRLIFH